MRCRARCLLCLWDGDHVHIGSSDWIVGASDDKRRLHGLTRQLGSLIRLNWLYSFLFGLNTGRLTLPHYLFVVVAIYLGSLNIRRITHAALTRCVFTFFTCFFDLLAVVVCVYTVVTPSLHVNYLLVFMLISWDLRDGDVVPITVVWRLNEYPVIKSTCDFHFLHSD